MSSRYFHKVECAWILGISLLLASCQSDPFVLENNKGTTVQTPVALSTLLLGSHPSNTSTPTKVTLAYKPSPTLIQTLEPTKFATQEIIPNFDSQLLMLNKPERPMLTFRSTNEGILDVSKELEFDPLPSGDLDSGYNYAISPTGAYVAYNRLIYNTHKDVIGEELVIFDHNFQVVTRFPWDEDWRRIQRWLSDEWILVRTFSDGDDPRDQGPNRTIFNPFRKEKRILTGIAPDIFDPCYGFPEWDPTLRYSYVPLFTPSISGFQHVVWDSIAQRIVVSLDSPQGCPLGIQWSQQREQMIIALHKEFSYESSDNFYRLSFDGTVETLLHEDYISQPIRINNFRLSPDEQKIAYFFRFKERRDLNSPIVDYFAILDIKTGKPDIYPDEFVRWDYKHGFTEYDYPSWSMNSRFVAVNYWADEQTSEVLIIDTETGQKVWEIEGKMEVVGWIKQSSK